MKTGVASRVVSFLAVLWLLLCVAGLYKLSAYEHTPTTAMNGPANWPDLGVPRKSAYTLVLSIHPQCPCSRATLQELAIAITQCPKLQTVLLFVKPKGMSETWVKSDLWTTASKFPRCELIVDDNGRLSSAFHARSSGQSYLYDPTGHLVFSGGMTGSRGHVGDNNGLATIISLANNKSAPCPSTKVFGCPLFSVVAVTVQKPER